MSKKLYVGNLSYDTTEQQLRELFSQVGEITDLTVLSDGATGESRGFGFVEMATDEGADEAITRFNGYALGGRDLVVNVARPRTERSGSSSSRY